MTGILDLLPPAWRAFLWRHIFVWSTLYLLLILVLLVIFGQLAAEIREQESLVTIDQQIADQFYRSSTPLTDQFFSVFTLLGSGGVVILAVAGAVYLAWRRAWVHFWLWAIAIGGGEALNLLLKDVFTRARPVVDVPILVATGYSFPSGHAMMSIIAYGVVAYFMFLSEKTWRGRTAIVALFTGLILLIGLSRIALVVHFFTDVVGGFIMGGAWLAAIVGVFERVRRRKGIREIEPESLQDDSAPEPPSRAATSTERPNSRPPA